MHVYIVGFWNHRHSLILLEETTMVMTRLKTLAVIKAAEPKILTRWEKIKLLNDTEFKMNRACKHLILLNDKIGNLSRHYHRARAANHEVFRYNYRLKLAVYEGIRNVFHEYARHRAEDVAELRLELFNQRVTIVSGEDPEEMESESEDSDEN